MPTMASLFHTDDSPKCFGLCDHRFVLMSKRRKIALCIAFGVLLFFTVGKILDRLSEAKILLRYPRDGNGVIAGINPPPVERGSRIAVILVHGIMETPEVFNQLGSAIIANTQVDLYRPLLPNHGRDLATARELNNDVVRGFLDHYVQAVADSHFRVLLVGLSFGGAHAIDMVRRQVLPPNVSLLLMAPGVYTVNHDLAVFRLRAFGLWRSYCNYELMGCQFPVFQSGDDTARPFLIAERNLQHVVISAALRAYELDSQNRDAFDHLSQPFTLMIAEDDNRVSFEEQARSCHRNRHCTLQSFPSGKHLLLHSAHREQVIGTVLRQILSIPGENGQAVLH